MNEENNNEIEALENFGKQYVDDFMEFPGSRNVIYRMGRYEHE